MLHQVGAETYPLHCLEFRVPRDAEEAAAAAAAAVAESAQFEYARGLLHERGTDGRLENLLPQYDLCPHGFGERALCDDHAERRGLSTVGTRRGRRGRRG